MANVQKFVLKLENLKFFNKHAKNKKIIANLRTKNFRLFSITKRGIPRFIACYNTTKDKTIQEKIRGTYLLRFLPVLWIRIVSGFTGVPGSWRQKGTTKLHKVNKFLFSEAQQGFFFFLKFSVIKNPPESGSTWNTVSRSTTLVSTTWLFYAVEGMGGTHIFLSRSGVGAKFWFDLNTRIQRRNL